MTATASWRRDTRCPPGSKAMPACSYSGSEPTGPHAPLEPARREQVDGGQLLGEHHRVAVVVAGHQGADAQLIGRQRRRGEGRHDPELVAEVVRDEQRRVAEVLDLAAQLAPLLEAGRGVGADRRTGRGGRGRSCVAAVVRARRVGRPGQLLGLVEQALDLLARGGR